MSFCSKNFEELRGPRAGARLPLLPRRGLGLSRCAAGTNHLAAEAAKGCQNGTKNMGMVGERHNLFR